MGKLYMKTALLLQDEEEEWQPTFTQDESLLGGGQQGGGGFQDPSPTIEMMGEDYGTPSVTYEDVMGMQEEDLLEFLKNTQFGGEWPGADQDAKDKFKEDMRTELGQGLKVLLVLKLVWLDKQIYMDYKVELSRLENKLWRDKEEEEG